MLRLLVYANAGPKLAECVATRDECEGLRKAEREKEEREMRVAFMMAV